MYILDTGSGITLVRSGTCCAPRTLLLDPRVNILLSEVAERSHKTPSPDLRTKLRHVRDIHEVYRMFGEMICGTHMVHVGSPEREEATFLLLPRATSCI
jgi:hypothetical protein